MIMILFKYLHKVPSLDFVPIVCYQYPFFFDALKNSTNTFVVLLAYHLQN